MSPSTITSKLNQIYHDLNDVIERLPGALNNNDQKTLHNSENAGIFFQRNKYKLGAYDENVINEIDAHDDSLLPSADFLRAILRISNFKQNIFGKNHIFDPTWTMMIELALAKSTGAQISVTSLGLASNAPSSTAIRYIDLMVKDGMFEKVVDRKDRRRTFVQLTTQGEKKIHAYSLFVENEIANLLKTVPDDEFAEA